MWCLFILKVGIPISFIIWLADEMYKNRHKTFKITIGKPIPWQTFDKSRSHSAWAAFVRDLVYKI